MSGFLARFGRGGSNRWRGGATPAGRITGTPAARVGASTSPARAGTTIGATTFSRRRRVAVFAIGGVLALATGVLVSAGAAAGAQTTTVDLSYQCAFASAAQPVDVKITGSFPATDPVGQAITPADVAFEVTLPAAATSELAAGGTTSVTPQVSLATAIAQQGAATTAQWLLAAPATALPASGAADQSLSFTATGAVPAVTPATTGELSFTAGNLTLVFSSSLSVSCALGSGVSGAIAAVSVSATSPSATPSGTATSATPTTTTAPSVSGSGNPKANAVTPNAILLQLVGWVVGETNVFKLGNAAALGPAEFTMTETGSGIVNGDFHLYFTAPLAMPDATATFLTFGFTPTVGMMSFTEVGGPMTIDSRQHAGVPHATVVDHEMIRLHDVYVNGDSKSGTELDVGDTCETATPVTITLTGVGTYQPVLGGPLEGTVTIPPFTGCVGANGQNLDSIFTGSISGPGNFMRMIQGRPCNVTVKTCKPTVPIFY